MNETTFNGNGKAVYMPVIINSSPAKQTNADRIRAMTDEELTNFVTRLGNIGCSVMGAWHEEMCSKPCYLCWRDWLKQEAQE